MRFVIDTQLEHEIVSATWHADETQWSVDVTDAATRTTTTEYADFVVYATGLLSKPLWPKLAGESARQR